MNKIYLLLMAIITVFLYKCDLPDTPEFQQEISVIAILRPGSDHQQFSVYNTCELIADSVSTEDLFVKNAEVKIKGGGQEIEFIYVFDEDRLKSIYVDSSEKLIVKSGEYYELIVETENGTLTGETLVPHLINIIDPLQGDSVVEGTNLNLLWNTDEFAYGYIINLLCPPVRIQFSEDIYFVSRKTHCLYTTDTSFVIPSDYLTFPNEPSQGEYIEEDLRCTLKIMALDKNFKNHLLDGYNISGVEGGYGLFGSVMIDSLDFYIVEYK